MSPTATEIVDFFKDAMKENRTVGRDELLGDTFSPAVSAGISCLAALPSLVQELIPEPYNCLSNTTVEEIYASCMDPEDNCFDIKQFERFCEERIREATSCQEVDLVVDSEIQTEKYGRHGRRILTGDHYWIVLVRQNSPLTHPFEPPPPFSDRLSELRPNRRMKVSRKMATAEPRPRSVWTTSRIQERELRDGKDHFLRHQSREVKHADIGDLLKAQDGSVMSILDVEYKRAFPEFQHRGKKKGRKKMQFEFAHMPPERTGEVNGEQSSKNGRKQKQRKDFDVAARMREYKLVLSPSEPLTNIDGETPLLLLKQLSEAQMIGNIEWNYTMPSRSSYASVNPHTHEHVQLSVGKGTKKGKSVLFEDLTYEQDRDTNHVSRQNLRHHLSSFALCDIVGPQKRWSEMSFKELKDYLLRQMTQKWQSKES